MLDSAENSLKHRLSAYWWIVTTNGRAEVSNVRARWNGLQTQTLTLTADLASRTRLACTPFTLSTTIVPKKAPAEPTRVSRSEEHTSELQSQSNLVCRLLLEKNKIHNN